LGNRSIAHSSLSLFSSERSLFSKERSLFQSLNRSFDRSIALSIAQSLFSIEQMSENEQKR